MDGMGWDGTCNIALGGVLLGWVALHSFLSWVSGWRGLFMGLGERAGCIVILFHSDLSQHWMVGAFASDSTN